jgi:hypothetical protein
VIGTSRSASSDALERLPLGEPRWTSGMAGKVDQEARMALKALKERGSSARSIVHTMGTTEGAVRYHLRRPATRSVRRKRQGTRLARSKRKLEAPRRSGAPSHPAMLAPVVVAFGIDFAR